MADYYQILGVSRDADAAQIQQGYRRRAREHHPDISTAPGAEDRFKEISQAYSVLSDPEQRRYYDAGLRRERLPHHATYRTGGRTLWNTPSHRFNDAFLDDLFTDLFDGMFGRRPGGFGRRAPGADYEADLELTVEEAFQGGQRTLTFDDGSTPTVRIPPGVTNGHRIRLTGEGGPGYPPGDLFLQIRLEPHPRYRIDGRDVHVDLPVTAWEAALGASIPLDLPGSRVTVEIPAGTSGPRTLRLPGHGLPHPHELPGDLYAEVHITVPSNLTSQERRLFQRLAQTSRFNPRDTG